MCKCRRSKSIHSCKHLVSDTYEKDLSKYADKEINSLSQGLKNAVSSVTVNNFFLQKKQKNRKNLEKIHVGDTIARYCKECTDFGAFIDLGGADGLRHISRKCLGGRVENPKKVFRVGDEVKVLIKEINGDKIALSMKFPEENPWLSAAEDFAVGNVVTGKKVARMTISIAFVRHLESMHFFMSQISREHVAKPSDVLSIGQGGVRS